MPINSGTDFVTKIPEITELSEEKADIQKTLKDFLYGSEANADLPTGSQTDGSDGLAGHLNSRYLELDKDNAVTQPLKVNSTSNSSISTVGGVGIGGNFNVLDNLTIRGNIQKRYDYGFFSVYMPAGQYELNARQFDKKIWYSSSFNGTPQVTVSPCRDDQMSDLVWHTWNNWGGTFYVSAYLSQAPLYLDTAVTINLNWIAVGNY